MPSDDDLYQHLVNTNAAELGAYWARYNVQAILNAAMAGAWVATRGTWLPRLLPVVGIAAALFWWGLTALGDNPIDMGLEMLRQLEASASWPNDIRPFTRQRDGAGPSLRLLAKLLPLLFAAAWIAVLARAYR